MNRTLEIGKFLLRVSVFIHAVALFIIVFQTRQTQFGVLLFMDWLSEFEDPHLAAVLFEKITVSLYIAAGVVVLFKPYGALLLFMAGYAFLEALSGVMNNGSRYSEWSLVEQALRYGSPLVLLILASGSQMNLMRRWNRQLATALLRILVALVFFSHGYLALLGYPRFIDLIIGTSANIFGSRLSEASTVTLLKWTGGIDFGVALAVLIFPTPLFIPRRFWASPSQHSLIRRAVVPTLMLWLAAWGLVTALSRITALGLPTGLSQYPELLIRTSHMLGPLALWALLVGCHAPSSESADPSDLK